MRRFKTDHPRECGANKRFLPPSLSNIGSSRECGANDDNSVFGNTAYGSSPRVRGKHSGTLETGRVMRIIPASAGQTMSLTTCDFCSADHPRECGANVRADLGDHPVHGSSPRVRGKPTEPHPCGLVVRIIPASAGQTTPRRHTRPRMTDHPRECGANARSSPMGTMRCGSSPRVRGKLVVSGRCSCVVRIIPASAGQT
ncbi:hypothetical protein GSD1FS_1980 [Bifidobacterium sp. GSD1FS]|uniref:Uncharacterized protein n=1 Tax=Bifidobacterium canis TaxID=2610880 RepID=A0A7K1J7F4_9BIFI|nr:hypothetical protein [Bifidobacterium canis]